GTLLEVGQGRLAAGRINAIFDARDRRLAGPPLPSRGLHLISGEYLEKTLRPPVAAPLHPRPLLQKSKGPRPAAPSPRPAQAPRDMGHSTFVISDGSEASVTTVPH